MSHFTILCCFFALEPDLDALGPRLDVLGPGVVTVWLDIVVFGTGLLPGLAPFRPGFVAGFDDFGSGLATV